MAKELVQILLSCIVWGPVLAKHRALFQCDNLSLVVAICKGSSKYKVLFVTPTRVSTSSTLPTPPATTGGCSRSGLDIHRLQQDIPRYYKLGSASSKWRSYNSGIRHYLAFCNQANRATVPTSESTLLLFIYYLASRNLSYPTIKVYLPGIRNLHVVSGHDVTIHSQLTPRLHQVLKGICKEKASTLPSSLCRPITRDIMLKIKVTLFKSPHSYHNIMMWAACCFAFFGFLRSSEFTIPTQSGYDPEIHLLPKDVAVDNRAKPRMLKVIIKQSKTDPFRQGVTLCLGKTDSQLCPVDALLPYMAVRGNQEGPLFIMADGRRLTHQLFSD